MKKRLPLYLFGLLIMALGVVLIKKSDLGMSPLSAIPAAVHMLLPRFTLGNTTIAFHIICMLLEFALLKRLTLKTALLLPLAVVFGYIIDLYMLVLSFLQTASLLLRFLMLFGGIFCTALGIVIISHCDLMLPAPDSFLRTASLCWDRPLGTLKFCGDALWVLITLGLELGFAGCIASVGIGTVCSVLFTGPCVTLLKKHCRSILPAF